MLVICLCNGCSTLRKKGYSVNEHYVILNTHKYMIFVSFKSLTIDQKKSACDFIAAIRYIEEANNNIQINPTNLTSDKDLFIMELWDSKIEGLLRKRIPIFFNKEKNVWGKNTRLNMLEHLLEVSV